MEHFMMHKANTNEAFFLHVILPCQLLLVFHLHVTTYMTSCKSSVLFVAGNLARVPNGWARIRWQHHIPLRIVLWLCWQATRRLEPHLLR